MYKVYDNVSVKEEFEMREEAFAFIKGFIKGNNFKSYYYVITQINDSIIRIDYGSHSHFFYIENTDGKLSMTI